jgi:hypothetical protein
MCKTTHVDRETASSLNPFIGTHCTEDCLSSVALTLGEIGSLLTSADSPQPENLWWMFAAMSSALSWEAENIHSFRLLRENSHV